MHSGTACSPPTGTVSAGGDCEDDDPAISPNATEVCDAADVDEDCTGLADDNAPDAQTWYRDEDNDDFGDETEPLEACDPPEGYAQIYGDCDDNDTEVHPDATEICDGIDNNCDDLTDEGFPDNDIDGQADCVDLDDDNDGSIDCADSECLTHSSSSPGARCTRWCRSRSGR